MSRGRALSLIAVVVLLLSSTGVGFAQDDRPQFAPEEVLVKFKPATSVRQIQAFGSSFQTLEVRYFDFIDVYHLKLPAGASVEATLEAMRQDRRVEYVEPNGLYYLDVVPNDSSFGDLWGLHNTGQDGGTPDADIDAPEAWEISTGSPDVVIAIIDSGLDMDHQDIASNLWTNPGEVAGNGVDDDGNGFIDDVHGWDFSSDDNDPSPAGGGCLGHGTHTAGTIGALGNNGLGVAGVNWDVQIMPIKAFRSVLGILCSASDADLIGSIQYHTRMGVLISSNSWGGGGANAAMQDAIRASNSLFVAAAGNGGLDGVGDNNDVTPSYPASYPLYNIVAVAATDRNDALAGFSNFGPTSVDLAAPGVAVLSTLPDDQYGSYSGTSMATPHVAGVAGLLLAQDPSLTINELKWRLLRAADNKGLPVISQGRLNAATSLSFGLSAPGVSTDIEPLSATDVPAGGSISFRVTLSNTTATGTTGTLRLYLRLANGQVISLGELSGALGGGESVSGEVTRNLPAAFTPGTTFRIFSQVETPGSLDEDWVEYHVVP